MMMTTRKRAKKHQLEEKEKEIETAVEIPDALTCPVCYHLLFCSQVCREGHSVCGSCYERILQDNKFYKHPECPICRSDDSWSRNINLDNHIEASYPKMYEEAKLQVMKFEDIRLYLQKNVDPKFAIYGDIKRLLYGISEVQLLYAIWQVATKKISLQDWTKTLQARRYDTFNYQVSCVVVSDLITARRLADTQVFQVDKQRQDTIRRMMSNIYYNSVAIDLLDQLYIISCQIGEFADE